MTSIADSTPETKQELRDVCAMTKFTTLASSTAPSVANSGSFKTANATPITITNFTGGYDGQRISVAINDVNTTLDFTGASLRGNDGIDWSPSVGDSLIAVYDGTLWWCLVSTAATASSLTDQDIRDACFMTIFNSLTLNDPNPSVASGGTFKTQSTVLTEITGFASGSNGQVIRIVINDVNTVIDFTSANLVGNHGLKWYPEVGDTFTAVKDGTTPGVWFCIISTKYNEATYNVKDYGAKGDSSDCTIAVQACVTAAGPNSTVYFPEGTYLITDEILISDVAVFFQGESQRGTKILFTPTAHDKACFNWSLGQNPGGIDNFWFVSTDKAYRKIAINFIDGSDFHISKIHIGTAGDAIDSWNDASYGSVGIQGYGREVVSMSKLRIFADNPIKLGVNPLHTTIDVDQFHLYDTYLIVTRNAPNATFFVDDDCNIFNFNIAGYNAWALGKYGIYWVTTTNSRVSHGVNISGIRLEQGQNISGDAYCIYIDNGGANTIRQFSIDHVYGDIERNRGFYLRGFHDLRMTNCRLLGPADGSGTCLELQDSASGTMKYVEWDNCMFGIYGAQSVISDQLILLEGTEYPQNDPAATAAIKLPTSAKYRRKKPQANQEQGQLIASDVRRVRLKANLLAPQTGSSDIHFTGGGGSITSTGLVDFTGMLAGELVFVHGTVSNNGWYYIVTDGTTTSLVTNATFTSEFTVSATIIHGTPLPHRGLIDYMQKTEITVYADNENNPDKAQYLLDNSGITGTGTGITNPVASTIITRNADTGTTLPTEDTFCYKAILQPAQFYNVRGYAPVSGTPGPKSVARVFIEQTNW